jgi:large subunit ribosomal protein L24
MRRLRLKKGDTVRVISGKHRGAEGEVLQVLHDKQRVLVKNVNVIKKAQRPTQQNPRGGFKDQEAALHVSKVALVDDTGATTRVRMGTNDEGKKVRVSVKSGKPLDE